ncbi:hypothetical protein QNH26_09955 [Peribacillus frigoritolerans]|uniref:hypothetical protein n=1 Tax=Peribacillus frigoritolerans TaxID=450367 RepID=UPI0024C1971E|nr:hypothetical protein [Peribacillus frigoritolerans]WHX68865.1 hypothetical protein QNH26_09955 [Peribacillus frigoritolerans]
MILRKVIDLSQSIQKHQQKMNALSRSRNNNEFIDINQQLKKEIFLLKEVIHEIRNV